MKSYRTRGRDRQVCRSEQWGWVGRHAAGLLPPPPTLLPWVLVVAFGACGDDAGQSGAWVKMLSASSSPAVVPAARYDGPTPDGRTQAQVAEACRIAESDWRCRFRVSPWADVHALWVTAGDKGCDADAWATGAAWHPQGTKTSPPPCLWPGQFWNDSPLDGTSSAAQLSPVDAGSLVPADALYIAWDTGAPVPMAAVVFEEPETGIRFAGQFVDGTLSVPEPCLAVAGATCTLPHGVPFDVRIYLEAGGDPQPFTAILLEATTLRVPCVDTDGDGHCDGGGDDCDDTNPEVYPGAEDVPYNGEDEDCSGSDLTDVDGDGFPGTDVPGGTDCDDTNPDVYPGAVEIPYDGLDNDCSGGDADDLDGDGYSSDLVPGGDDCDDANPDVHPGAIEVPYDGQDTDCSGSDLTDVDGDGYAATVVAGGTDCRDTDPTVYPGATEACDGQDNDCNGTVDEGLDPHYYPDADGDGFGVETGAICGPAQGFASARGDCDDANPAVHPGAADIPDDGVDSDCGGSDGPQPHVALSPDSFPGLQEAILAATDGATVWVGPGTYLEADVSLAGRTLTLISTQGPESTTIDAHAMGRVLILESNEGPTTTVAGFTLTGGAAESGAGLMVRGTSPSLEDLIVTDNEATGDGGGFFVDGGAPHFSRTRVENNLALAGGGGYVGGAAEITLEDVSIAGNAAETGAGLCLSSATLVARRVHVENNRGGDGGGLAAVDTRLEAEWLTVADNLGARGGGMFLEDSAGTLNNATFARNASDRGGGLYLDQTSIEARNIVISENLSSQGAGAWMLKSYPTFSSAVFIHNEADQEGGAVYSDGCFAGLIQTIVLYNNAAVGGGLYTVDQGDEFWSPFVANSVVAFNEGFNVYDDPAAPDHPIVVYSDLYNPDQDNHNLGSLDASVLEVDPGFVAASPDSDVVNLHLVLESLLIDVGEPSVTDADGSPADLGVYGGDAGTTWDRDGDGWYDYFWPGSLDDAPAGYESGDWDPDDLDPGVP